MLVFLSLTLTLVIDTLFEKLSPQLGAWIWKKPSVQYASGVGISYKACLLFKNIFKGDLFFDVLILWLF